MPAEVKMAESITAVMKIGCKRGSVMYENCWSTEAPSISAASYSSFGMACSPARKLIVKNGVPCQTTTMITESIARCGSESHEIVSSIRFRRTRTLLMSPLASSKIQRQFRADMTVGMAQGINRIERNRLLQKRS